MVKVQVQDQIAHDVIINASVERVWSLLTEGIGQWFPEDGAEVDLRLGGVVTLRWNQYGTFHGIIEQLDPMTTFAVRWSLDPDQKPIPGRSTLVEFTVSAEPTGVRVRVVESGFSQLTLAPEEQANRAAENAKGWEIELDELRALAEQPTA